MVVIAFRGNCDADLAIAYICRMQRSFPVGVRLDHQT